MNLKKKALLMVAVCVIAGSASLTALADNVSYSTNQSLRLASVYNNSAYSTTIAVNTRPTTGQSGARVKITMSDGTVVASQVFPYYTYVSDLTAEIPSSNIRRIYVEPVQTGQTIEGVLGYSFR